SAGIGARDKASTSLGVRSQASCAAASWLKSTSAAAIAEGAFKREIRCIGPNLKKQQQESARPNPAASSGHSHRHRLGA
ncbi:MAG: hypothetical protein AAFR44_07515, partial [Pseudomonadota bacterium]